MSDYWRRHYCCEVNEGGADKLSLRKSGGTDWCQIVMQTNGRENGSIDIRSREMAEQLHFMLGQMLEVR